MQKDVRCICSEDNSTTGEARNEFDKCKCKPALGGQTWRSQGLFGVGVILKLEEGPSG